MIRWLIVVGICAVACTPPRRADTPAPATDPTRIRHDQHLQVSCSNCHRASAKRPGADDHKPCDDPACHKKEFLGTPGPFCQSCHTKVTTSPLDAPLKEYPIEDPWQALPPVFSHRRHMDAALMEKRVGFHVACMDCHISGDFFVRPNHATCARCHAAEAKLPKAPRMEDCSGCHQGAPRQRTRARVRTGDIQFHHERHRNDRKGIAIKCETCHGRSAKSDNYEDHGPPRIESCVGCHDDADRVPYQMRMRICEGCHLEKTSSLTALAPRNHLPATERPLDHTLAFRRDHAEAAARTAERCATCHTQMSGNPRQACDECHQRMVPADHRITFRELDHGPEAIADRTRCATCHVVEFCTACHSQRPRSHGFQSSFFREHGRLARLNVRACITCHVESFCQGCHSGLQERRR
ncbi:MAG: cytochrome c3 family protein [Kofleriaceae bacterium]